MTELLEKAISQLKTLPSRQQDEIAALILEELSEINNAADVSKSEVLEDFRQAWHEAMTGQTIPVAQLWEELENV
jgi:hypothetical protein